MTEVECRVCIFHFLITCTVSPISSEKMINELIYILKKYLSHQSLIVRLHDLDSFELH